MINESGCQLAFVICHFIHSLFMKQRKTQSSPPFGNAWDSKNNIALTQLFIEAGGEGNREHTHPMLQLLTSVRKEVQQVTHLNN